MKKLFAAFAVLVSIAVTIQLLFGTFTAPTSPEPEFPTGTDGAYCFSFSRAATATEPFAVSETVSLTIAGDTVTGTKTGTQHGPGMSNGYQGTLSGTISGNTIEAVFSYVVEGAANKELEVYAFDKDMLTKLRWALKEERGMLVPDRSAEPVRIVYGAEKCAR